MFPISVNDILSYFGKRDLLAGDSIDRAETAPLT